MTGKATVKMKYRLLCISRLSSALVRASVPAMSVRLPCWVSVGRVVFGGDGEEGLLEAEAGDLDLARPVARVEDGVERGVRVARLDLHHVVPDLEVHQPGQARRKESRLPPARALISAGVPSASSRPRLMTRIRSAAWSASSR